MILSKSVILTRPDGLNDALEKKIKKTGINTYSIPLISIIPLEKFDKVFLPSNYDFVIFVSGNAVRLYLKEVFEKKYVSFWPPNSVVATVGPATAKVFKSSKYVLPNIDKIQILFPNEFGCLYDSESLFLLLKKNYSLLGKRVLIVRGVSGRNWLLDKLKESGCFVEICSIYLRKKELLLHSQLSTISKVYSESKEVIWIFTSNEIVSSFFLNLKYFQHNDFFSKSSFIVIHYKIKEFLERCFLEIGLKNFNIKICEPIEESIFFAITSD
ncbi:MAG: uroporphyrinogen-III synthase [Candidatus Kinetoplastibacterium crithidii]|nr:MAG: uroporphyrinogen-III synthase [Candidatus Kinetoplastibacterium crithidii]